MSMFLNYVQNIFHIFHIIHIYIYICDIYIYIYIMIYIYIYVIIYVCEYIYNLCKIHSISIFIHRSCKCLQNHRTSPDRLSPVTAISGVQLSAGDRASTWCSMSEMSREVQSCPEIQRPGHVSKKVCLHIPWENGGLMGCNGI